MKYLLTANGNIHPNTSKLKNIIKMQISSTTLLSRFQNGGTTYLPGDVTEGIATTSTPCAPIHGSHRGSPFGFGTLVLNFCRKWRYISRRYLSGSSAFDASVPPLLQSGVTIIPLLPALPNTKTTSPHPNFAN